MFPRLLLSATPFLALLLACSGSPSSSIADYDATNSSQNLSDAFCADVCGAYADCQQTVDAQTCERQCANATAVAISKQREELTTSITECVAVLDCATIIEGHFIGPCIDQSLAELAPNNRGRNFCEALDEAALQCGTETDRAACLNAAKLYNDGTLKAATQCTAKACNQISDCVTATLLLPNELDGSPARTITPLLHTTTSNLEASPAMVATVPAAPIATPVSRPVQPPVATPSSAATPTTSPSIVPTTAPTTPATVTPTASPMPVNPTVANPVATPVMDPDSALPALCRAEDSCDACVQAQCCDDLVAFVDAPGSDALLHCIEQCAEDTCIEDCLDAEPLAGSFLESVVDCSLDAETNACSEQCEPAVVTPVGTVPSP